MNYDRAELLDRLAAEYVFGTMSPRVRARFRVIQRSLPSARHAVQMWEQRLTPLAQSVPAEQPSAATWNAIERRIEGRGPRINPAWRNWLKPLAGVAFGVFASLGLVRIYPQVFVPLDQIVQEYAALPASYVGILTDADNEPIVLASSMRHGRTMSIKVLRKVAVPANKVLQIWALPQDGAPPFPLGISPSEGKGTFEMADTSQNLLRRVSRLAVSIEDAPARPGETPGRFILIGHCVRLW